MTFDGDLRFAEMITAHGYRRALNNAWEQSPEIYSEQQIRAEEIVYRAAQTAENLAQADWDARRQAVLAVLGGTDLGAFQGYFYSLDGYYQVSKLTKHDLGPGEAGPVGTNAILREVNEIYDDPIDFLSTALLIINDRNQAGPHNIGPENYATTLKYVADKFSLFHSQYIDREKLKPLIEKWSTGFSFAAQKESPNFVEMTNVYFAIRALPQRLFSKDFSKVLLVHSLEQMPSYHRDIFPVMFGALAKLPLDNVGEEAATLVDLAMRQFSSFHTTNEMRVALRAIANLPMSAQANRAFNTFLELRNNLEKPMDEGGLDETNELLVRIVNNVITDPALILEAKELAKTCAARAVAMYKRAEAAGELSESQMADLHKLVDRIVVNWTQI